MKRTLIFLATMLLLFGGSFCLAFVEQIAVSPQKVQVGEPITFSIRAGECEGVDAPSTWTLEGTDLQ